MNDAITITKDQLQAALKNWEQDHRDGKCLSAEEARAMSVDEVAAASAGGLWAKLQKLAAA